MLHLSFFVLVESGLSAICPQWKVIKKETSQIMRRLWCRMLPYFPIFNTVYAQFHSLFKHNFTLYHRMKTSTRNQPRLVLILLFDILKIQFQSLFYILLKVPSQNRFINAHISIKISSKEFAFTIQYVPRSRAQFC